MVRHSQGREQAPARQAGRAGGWAHRHDQTAVLRKKEAVIGQYLGSEGGIRKLAASMANPVRERLDYKGIARKLGVVEQMPDGVPLIYDRDLPEVAAVATGIDGNSRITEMRGERIQLNAFDIVSRVKIPYSELFERRYRTLDRAKDRLIQGMNLKEDLIFFGLLDAAYAIGAARSDGPIAPDTSGPLDRDFLARGFTEVEKNRNVVMSVLMSPYGTQGIRRLDFQNMDQIGMQEIRETGYLGELWGASFYVSDKVTPGTAYVLAGPKMLAWFAIRKDVDVVPADDPDNVRLGLVGYWRGAMTVHNALGVCPVYFSTAA
jgi:hypothetical protein